MPRPSTRCPLFLALLLAGSAMATSPALFAQAKDDADSASNAAAITPVSAPSAADAGVAAIAKARDAVMPYVASILVVREDFEAGEPKLSVSSGSGTVVTPEGHIVTNAHVTDRGRSYRVVFGDGREREAILVGQDTASDLAVLKVQGEATPMPHARFADVDDLRAGETVFAMGAPWGLSNSLSAGVVNNPLRLLVSLFEDEADYEDRLDADSPTGLYYAWIQHDAAIAPGNSGGPLVDLDGTIVGVNTRGMMFGGDLAFAIPADDVKAVVKQLIEHGEVRRSRLGVSLRSLRGSGETRGVLVNAVERDSPGDKAGLKPGDRLLSIDGVALDAPQAVDVPSVQRRFAELAPGTGVTMQVSAMGQTRSVTVVPERETPARGDSAAFTPFGIAVQTLTADMSARRRLQVEQGLLVTSLRAGGPAATARPPLPAGAVITKLDDRPVSSLADLDVHRASQSPAKPVVVEYVSSGERRVSALTPVWGDRTRNPLPELPKAWVGVEVQPIPDSLARALGLPSAGFRITRLYPGSALGAAGAKVGDVLTTLDGEVLDALNDSRPELFDQRVREREIGDTAVFEGLRGDAPQRWTVTLAASPVPVAGLRGTEVSLLRAQFREMGFFDRVERELPLDQAGVLVQVVEGGGAAGLAHLQAGDVLVRIGDRRIDTLDALRPALRSAVAALERIPFEIIRRGETRIVHVERRWIPETL